MLYVKEFSQSFLYYPYSESKQPPGLLCRHLTNMVVSRREDLDVVFYGSWSNKEFSQKILLKAYSRSSEVLCKQYCLV